MLTSKEYFFSKYSSLITMNHYLLMVLYIFFQFKSIPVETRLFGFRYENIALYILYIVYYSYDKVNK